MNDKTLSKICLIITIIGMVLLALTYQEEFAETTLIQLMKTDGAQGKITGKVTFVIQNYPVTIFTLTDGTNDATIYYPKETTIETENIVTVYAQNQGTQNKKPKIYAHKVVKIK